MRITVLQGSPNRKGSTAILAEEFARGARDNGHDVKIIEVAHTNVHPCTGCVACGYGGPCVQHDGFDELRECILESDMLVFATPLYYYGMSAQLKACIDRGRVLGYGCGTPSMTRHSHYPQDAYNLGASL